MDLSGLFVAVQGRQVVGAGLGVPSAGRMCLVMPPCTVRADVDPGRLLGGCLALNRDQGMAWAQALVEPGAFQDRRVLEDGGFGAFNALKRSLLASAGAGAAYRSGNPSAAEEAPDTEEVQGELFAEVEQ